MASSTGISLVRYKGGVIGADSGRGIEKGCFHVLLDVADFGGVLAQTVKDKADMLAVQFHKLCLYKLCRVIVPGDTDCLSSGADGFKHEVNKLVKPVPVKLPVLQKNVIADVVLDDFLVYLKRALRYRLPGGKHLSEGAKIARNKIWTLEPEYGTIYVAVLGFFLVIEGGVHMGKDLKDRDLGVGIYQRQDGLYSARYTNKLGKRKVF